MAAAQDRQTCAIARSTIPLPAGARANYWREVGEQLFPGLTIDWLSNQPIRAWLQSRPIDRYRVTEICNTPERVSRPVHSRASDEWLLVLQRAGAGRYRQAGREVIQNPGDLVLLDGERGFDAVLPHGMRVQVWRFPRQALAARLHVPDDAAGRRIAGNHRPGAMLAVHTRLLAAAAGHLDALQQQRMAAQMCDLTALALGATPALRERCRDICRAARRQQILAYIETHLRDSNLSDVRAAHALGISRRWLHALFDEGGRSFAAWVTQRRLEESRKLLDSPDRDELSITHIALESGFNDLSTFNRCFRRRYLITPREARRSRRSGQPEKR